ncbi:MAG TPA: DUF1576 domain-containing protein [Tissierellaceae bacterium]|nr:DUF1576 domain-containing protein [Tissierellaceae bacterium]
MSTKPVQIDEKTKYIIISMYAIIILLTSFLFNTPYEILEGMKDIILSPSTLVSDYFVVGNLGAAFFNSSLIMIITIVLAIFNKIKLKGPIIAAIFMLGGFALFGKNIYNIWAIIFGAYLYSLIKKEPFSNYIVIAFYGTSLAPLVSNLSFQFGFNPILGIILANVCGSIAGFILAPLAYHYKSFHMDYNLYNVGFTAGIIGTLFMSLFRAFGLENESLSLAAYGYNQILSTYYLIMFISMIIIGFLLNGMSFKGYKELLQCTGKAPNDFVQINGFGVSFINMGIMGILALSYILLIGAELNGPTIGGILTVVGFSAFGKHPKNALPVVLGFFIGALITIREPNSTVIAFSALFVTALAPIAGSFGVIAGMIAGFFHSLIVTNLGYLHGGLNLYNNGFTAGFVAAILVPLINTFKNLKKS